MDNWEQLDLFGRPEIKIDKKIKLIEMFAGYGSQAMALERMGVDFDTHFVCEFDGPAIKSYNAVHNTNYETKDIRDVHGSDLNITDKDKYFYILTYSFPCFTGETLVLTDSGLKQIKDVKEGDKVIAHDNKYHEVLAAKKTGEKEIWAVKTMAAPETNCTDNHLFYVREMFRTYPYLGGKRGSERHFKEPCWLSCKDLTKKHYLGIAINQNSIMPEWNGVEFTWSDGRKSRKSSVIDVNNHSFWWLMGRYVGDGWIRSQGGIIICCAKNEESEITIHLRNCGFNYSVSTEKTVKKIHIPLKELSMFVECFGRGAENKHIPAFMYDMPENYLESFLEGYLSADGWIRKDGLRKIASISKELIFGTAQLVAKVYKTPYKIYFNKRKPTVMIEGRLCNQNSGYELVWKTEKKKQDKAFYEDGYIWVPVREIKNTKEIKSVYDIEVKDSHSFTANGIIAHNCTDLSLAGAQKGLSKKDWENGNSTRSGLLWEVERILKELVDNKSPLPDLLLLENVPQLVSDKFMPDFEGWLQFLYSIGYFSSYQILNAKNFGVAQNRDRVFMLSFLGEDFKYTFPRPIPLQKKLKDYLETEVDEKYYLKSEKAEQLIDQLVSRGVLDETKRESAEESVFPIDKSENNPKQKEMANCITAREDRGISRKQSEGNAVIEKKNKQQ